MKTVSYSIIHYGKDYLPYSLKSIYSHVDELYIFYTSHPSHGHLTDVTSPESRDELRESVFTIPDPDNKIRWFDFKGIYHEGQQRDRAVSICKQNGADIILVADYDEIWDGLTLTLAIEKVIESNSARNWLINFTHLWKSFNWCCRDEGWPVRFLDLRHAEGTKYIPQEYGEIYHFGYAITDKIMRYKWQIHGHKMEMRAGWLDNQWSAWPPAPDCHPTNDNNFWTPEPFNKEKLPEIMVNHPFYNLEIIE